MTLVQAMRRHPPVISPEATIRSAAREMASHATSLLPVVADRRIVGTLSAFDLVIRSLGGGLDPDRRTVRAVMRPDPQTCRPEDSIPEVRARMRALRVATLPVVEDNGELVGLVDLFDVEDAADDGSAAGPEPDFVKRVRGEPL